MADNKPDSVNTFTVDECEPCTPDSQHWFDFHMPCWVCKADTEQRRSELMWNDECEVYVHESCVLSRSMEVS